MQNLIGPAGRTVCAQQVRNNYISVFFRISFVEKFTDVNFPLAGHTYIWFNKSDICTYIIKCQTTNFEIVYV